ncbi:VWA domain-containing protein [Parathalassolituus penaei]|uniref:VWA domain-containing protein n=1 Tax=Parathalassolituus penaei TaxID=2997323 RepID=A0A9X3EGG9_9GAMM|nr:VWA domain-containing protein [Parathalassolituus penaei]MCY0966765.1 VWA domain-containing protein [Parathalassolituus penaei]
MKKPVENPLTRLLWAGLLWLVMACVHAAQQPADVRVVIDISGSMKQTDPNNLRVPALNLVVELLPDGSRGGVWTFAQGVNNPLPVGQVNDGWRTRARAAGKSINSSGQRTNLTEALEKAAVGTKAMSGYDQSVILLTDGRIDMAPASAGEGPNQASRERLFKTVLPAYKAAGVKIHTLALSDAADRKLLQQIAMETDGLYLEADTAEALSKSFLKAFERAAPAEEVGLKNNRFTIDNSIKEFTALVFRKPGGKASQLISPSGKTYDQASADSKSDLRWHNEVNFDLVTISNPEPGEWQVNADVDPDNRVRILSDLSLGVDGIAATLFSGDPVKISIALFNENRVVQEKALLQLTDFTLSITSPDGHTVSQLLSDPEKLPADGIFLHTLERLAQPGEYRFEIQAQGRTFNRQRVITANLSEPFTISEQRDVAGQQLQIRVSADSDGIDTGLSRVLVKVTNPDGSSVIQTMDFDQGTRSWNYDAMATQGDGEYQYELNIRGVSVGGKSFRSQPETIVAEFPLRETVATNKVAEKPAAAPAAEVTSKTDEAQTDGDQKTPVTTEATAVPAAPQSTELATTPAPDDATTATEEPLDWMFMAMVGGGVLVFLLILVGVFLFLRKRKKAKAEPAADNTNTQAAGTAVAVGSGIMAEAAELEPGDNIQEMDDFEAFMSAGEEQIPASGEEKRPDTLGGDTNINPLSEPASGADEALAEGLDDQDWGEFDIDEEDGKNK